MGRAIPAMCDTVADREFNRAEKGSCKGPPEKPVRRLKGMRSGEVRKQPPGIGQAARDPCEGTKRESVVRSAKLGSEGLRATAQEDDP